MLNSRSASIEVAEFTCDDIESVLSVQTPASTIKILDNIQLTQSTCARCTAANERRADTERLKAAEQHAIREVSREASRIRSEAQRIEEQRNVASALKQRETDQQDQQDRNQRHSEFRDLWVNLSKQQHQTTQHDMTLQSEHIKAQKTKLETEAQRMAEKIASLKKDAVNSEKQWVNSRLKQQRLF